MREAKTINQWSGLSHYKTAKDSHWAMELNVVNAVIAALMSAHKQALGWVKAPNEKQPLVLAEISTSMDQRKHIPNNHAALTLSLFKAAISTDPAKQLSNSCKVFSSWYFTS